MLFSQLAASLLLSWLEFLKSQKPLKTVKAEIPMICHPLIQQLGQINYHNFFDAFHKKFTNYINLKIS